MLKRLKLRFLFVNFGLLTLLLISILAGTAWLMQRAEQESSEAILYYAMLDLSGVSAPLNVELDETAGKTNRNLVSVTMDDSGSVLSLDYSQMDMGLSETEPAFSACAQKDADYLGIVKIEDMSFRYLCQRGGGSVYLVLLDRAVELDTLNRLYYTLYKIGFFGLMLLLAVSLLLTRFATKPIENAWRRQQSFVADASHELKTPLAVIAANTDVVLSNPGSSVESQGKWLDYITDETERMTDLVKNLLYIAKIDANEIQADRRKISISDLVLEFCMEHEIEVFEAGRILHYEAEPELFTAGDEKQLRELLSQLLQNAVVYSKENTEIHVRLFRERPGRLSLLISNEGKQIPPESLSRVFDRFYRVDDSRSRSSGGYGLGLSIAKCIVEMHEGKISIESPASAPILVTVVLPEHEEL